VRSEAADRAQRNRGLASDAGQPRRRDGVRRERRTVGPHGHQRDRRASSHEIEQELQRRRVRRLEIVEHDEHRAGRGDPVQQLSSPVEQTDLRGFGPALVVAAGHRQRRAQARQKAREARVRVREQRRERRRSHLVDERRERLRPRPVGRGAPDVPAAAAQHVATFGAHARAVLVEQAGLADARLAGEQHVLRLSGPRALPARLERGALRYAAHESNHATPMQ
jgi:hypothetical protein